MARPASSSAPKRCVHDASHFALRTFRLMAWATSRTSHQFTIFLPRLPDRSVSGILHVLNGDGSIFLSGNTTALQETGATELAIGFDQ